MKGMLEQVQGCSSAGGIRETFKISESAWSRAAMCKRKGGKTRINATNRHLNGKGTRSSFKMTSGGRTGLRVRNQVANYNDIKVGDIIEFFDMEQVAG